MTPAQLQTLKNDIVADATLNAFPNDSDGNTAIQALYNVQATPDFWVWRDLPMTTVINLITFASMTPADAVPTTPALTVDVWRARSLSCQGKQFNLQNLTLSRAVAPMRLINYRAAMQDCLTNLPAGAAGALISANWVGVRDAAKFLAKRLERLFATGTGSVASPGDIVVETVSIEEINTARNLP